MTTGRIPTGCIVVGIDAARATDRAVDWAADQAALEGRHLHLVHGTEAPLSLGSASAVTAPADYSNPGVALPLPRGPAVLREASRGG